jgi:hypothetical protein
MPQQDPKWPKGIEVGARLISDGKIIFLHNFKDGWFVMAPFFFPGGKETIRYCSLPYGCLDAIVQLFVRSAPFPVTLLPVP